MAPQLQALAGLGKGAGMAGEAESQANSLLEGWGCTMLLVDSSKKLRSGVRPGDAGMGAAGGLLAGAGQGRDRTWGNPF